MRDGGVLPQRASAVGYRYGGAHVRDGFDAHLAGVRLFLVQCVESAGLRGIAAATACAAPWGATGAAFGWFLCAYAVMRFGLKGLRADRRPHWLGLSQRAG